jgi:hypothetical protein
VAATLVQSASGTSGATDPVTVLLKLPDPACSRSWPFGMSCHSRKGPLVAVQVSVLDDGTLHYQVDGHAVLTGSHQGHVTLADGTKYHVTPAVIEVQEGHLEELKAALDARARDLEG